MRTFERITLIAVTTAYAGYIVRQVVHTRADRLSRMAAGESHFERTHPKGRPAKPPRTREATHIRA